MTIKIYGEPILRKRCIPVAKITQEERGIFEEMVLKMRQAGGVGLAACQVGINKQMLVVDVPDKALRLANPKICKRQGQCSIEEGCLSLPEIIVKVKRSKKIKLEAINENNQKVTLDADNLLAIILQHEVDHLQGKLIIDYLPWYKKISAINKLRKKRRKTKFKSCR